MPFQRHLFNLSDTGTMTDTGPCFFGEVCQYRWVNTGGDTGGSLEMVLMPRPSDTGEGFLIASHTLVPNFTKAPRQPQHGVDGAPDPADTGAAFGVPVVAAGDRIRVKKTGAAGVGRLYVWTRD